MSQALSDKTPLFSAKISGNGIDKDKFRIIVNGIPWKANYYSENNTFFYKSPKPVLEKFNVVTFEASDISGEIKRETRIFYIE